MTETNSSDIATLTVQLLSAFVSKNEVPSDALADLIKTTRAALTEDLTASVSGSASEPEYTPAVSVRKSLSSPDHILSMIDGKPYKTLKRHLSVNGLTEREYRARYNLPTSYPMVAQSYSQARRAIAAKNGLGKRAAPAAVAPAAQAEAPSANPAPAAQPTPKKAPAKAAAKKETGKIAPAKSVAVPAKGAAAKLKSAAPAPASRKKLSVFGSKDAKAEPVVAIKGDAPVASPTSDASAAKPKATKTVATKATRPAKPKSPKSALKAAGAHLGNAADKEGGDPASS